MRKKELIQKIDEASQNFSKPDLGKTEELITEVLLFFDYIRGKLQSTNEQDRASALADIQEVQAKLEEFSQKAIEASGMSPEQLGAFMANPQNFDPQDWKKLKTMEGNVRSFTQNNKT